MYAAEQIKLEPGLPKKSKRQCPGVQLSQSAAFLMSKLSTPSLTPKPPAQHNHDTLKIPAV